MTDPARWLSAEIPEWNELGRREKRSIRDSPILRALFELHATGQNGQRSNADPEQICNAVAQLAKPPALRRELISARAHFADRYFVDGHPTQAWRHLRVISRFHERVRRGLLVEDADKWQVLTALLSVVNRLRKQLPPRREGQR